MVCFRMLFYGIIFKIKISFPYSYIIEGINSSKYRMFLGSGYRFDFIQVQKTDFLDQLLFVPKLRIFSQEQLPAYLLNFEKKLDRMKGWCQQFVNEQIRSYFDVQPGFFQKFPPKIVPGILSVIHASAGHIPKVAVFTHPVFDHQKFVFLDQ